MGDVTSGVVMGLMSGKASFLKKYQSLIREQILWRENTFYSERTPSVVVMG